MLVKQNRGLSSARNALLDHSFEVTYFPDVVVVELDPGVEGFGVEVSDVVSAIEGN